MKICVFDTETGGIGAEAAQKWSIIQLGAVVYDDGPLPGMDQSFSVVIDESKVPQHTAVYDHEALAVNGYTLERIKKEGIVPSRAALRFIMWLHKNFAHLRDGERITLCGHNVGYDVSFLQRLFRLGGFLEEYDDIFSYRTIDTASIARFLIEAGLVPAQDAKSVSLFEHFNCAPTKAHDALSDAIATAHLYTKMLKLVKTPPVSIRSHPPYHPAWRM